MIVNLTLQSNHIPIADDQFELDSPRPNIDTGDLFHEVSDSGQFTPDMTQYESDFIQLPGSLCIESVTEDSRSDYLIFRDYKEFKYDVSGLNLDMGDITYTSGFREPELVTYLTSGQLPKDPSNYVARYGYNAGYKLVNITKQLVPDTYNTIELGITYKMNNLVNVLYSTIKLTEFDSITEIYGNKSVGEVGNVTFRLDSSESETDPGIICKYTNTQGTGDITIFRITGGTYGELFKSVSNYNNLYLYCTDSNVTDYYISSCKLIKTI